MTIREYISQQFSSLGLSLNDADCVNMGQWNTALDIDESNQAAVYEAFILYIPTLLLRPTSISEGGVSISRAQRSDIEAFYTQTCKKLGLRNELTPRVKFI